MDYDDRPRLVFWETTLACPLACVHCRATAQRQPTPDELTTDEGIDLIDEIALLGTPRPVLILTGGDCLARADLEALVDRARSRRVPVAVAPSVSPALNDRTIRWLHDSGVTAVSLSLDGAARDTHDGIRQVDQHYDATLCALESLADAGLRTQVNTTVMARNVHELPDITKLLVTHRVHAWEVFFLINVGRGEDVGDLSPEQCRDVCHFLVDAARYGFAVRTVEAPYFRRVARQREMRPVEEFDVGDLYRELHGRLLEQLGPPRGPVRAPTVATRDGKGVIFVARNGDVYPSGFLPLRVGNVRERPLLEIYRESPILRDIRAARFSGRCGRCDDRDLCGGSRARAYAVHGDPLAEDPACAIL